MRGHFGRQMPQASIGPPVDVFSMNSAQPTPAIHDTSILDSSLDFDDMCFDIGNAFVASDGPDGWHQLSNEHDSSLDFSTMTSPSAFDPNSWDMNMGLATTNLDLSSPPILPQVEPNFLDPTTDIAREPIANPACISCSSRQQMPAASMRTANNMAGPQSYVNPGIYLTSNSQNGVQQSMMNDSWRLQAL